MSSTDVLNAKLRSIFSNGNIEVGLEVGSDQGLSPDQYIRIPKCFEKAWAYCKVAEPKDRPNADSEAASMQGKQDWTVVQPGKKHIRVHKGKYYAVNPDGTNPEAVELFHRPTFTVGDVKQFLQVNNGHVRDNEFSVEQRRWIHAARFWATVAGFVCGSKGTEWIVVDNANDTTNITDDEARYVIEKGGESITASAARAANWRKSNHATGGDVASGFARRWISKNATWPNPPEAAKKREEQIKVTTAFYLATHASCVHPVLAMLAPSIDEHWAQLDPSYGLVTNWDVLESTQIRIVPKTQVAGTAIVVDSMVVLKMLVTEGLAPMLESAAQVEALVKSYKTVEEHGVRVATYANWFLSGHPDGTKRVPFAQKDVAHATLVGELATVARTFYRQSTIGESLALDNAMQQLATETAKNRWSALTKAKKTSSDTTVMAAYARVSGATASLALQNLVSDSATVVTEGIKAYNNTTNNIAALVGISNPKVISAERIVANMAATPASSIVEV